MLQNHTIVEMKLGGNVGVKLGMEFIDYYINSTFLDEP
jgi:hypothetical protein